MAPLSKSKPSSSNRARMRGTPQMGIFQQPVKIRPPCHYDEHEDILYLGKGGQEEEVMELSPGVI